MSHLIGSWVAFKCPTGQTKNGQVVGVSTLGLSVRDLAGVFWTADPDGCQALAVVSSAPETLADRLARVWFPILGAHARERANNVACWAGDWITPQGLFMDLATAIQIVNRPDYGGKLTEREIARAAALGLAEILA